MSIERPEMIPSHAYELCLDEPLCELPEEPDDAPVCAVRATTASRTERDALAVAAEGFLVAAAAFGEMMIEGGRAQTGFADAAREAVARLMVEVELGRMTSIEAATEVHRLRATLELQAGASSDVRRSWAALRGSNTGETFAAAERRVAKELFGTSSELTPSQRHAVHVRLTVELAEEGAAAARFGAALSTAGRAFVAVSAAISVHGIVTAEDKVAALAREALVLGAGRVGAMAGAAAGTALCGPGAPVCAPVGALVGDVLFSMGAAAVFDAVFDTE